MATETVGPSPAAPDALEMVGYGTIAAPVSGVVAGSAMVGKSTVSSSPKLVVLMCEKRIDQASTLCTGAAPPRSLRLSVTTSCQVPLMLGSSPASPVVIPA